MSPNDTVTKPSHVRGRWVSASNSSGGKDGTSFPVKISLSPLHAETEALIVSIIRDVTERKQAEERLRAVAAGPPTLQP
jgi:PAS domain S-box-containing protein